MNKNAKIFIAGHRGLVGSAIHKKLIEHGYNNLVFKSSIELDLRDFQSTQKFFSEEKPEYVFLAAAKVGGIHANNVLRADFIYDNIMIQSNVIHASYLNDVKKLLFLGSTCIYPKEASQPINEDALLSGPLEYTNEPYAIAKIAGIRMCESYNIQYNTNFLSIMPTNLYGPNDNFDLQSSHVLPALLRKIYLGRCLMENNWKLIYEDLKRRPLENINLQSSPEQIAEALARFGIRKFDNSDLVEVEIWGSGKPMREFLWSDDLAEACIFVMQHIEFKDLSTNMNEIRNTHLNVGTGEDIPISHLAQIIKDTLGFEGTLRYNTSKPDGTLRKVTNPAKIHSLGWKHKTDINQGIKKLYNWYLNNGPSH